MKLLTTQEVTKIIGRSRGTLHRWWKSGAFPAPLLYKKKTLGWSEESVKQWFKGNTNEETENKIDT
jgi:prophage regulatory protein